MPPPANIDEFLMLVNKSGVADPRRLEAFLKRTESDGTLPSTPASLAAVLIDENILTKFQTQHLLQGKWRGFTIGNFKVLERLGSGGMGNVYLCEHKVMRKRVAIKVLASVSAENPEVLKRFYREARAAAALDHPNIVRAHDLGKEEKLHYLVMDFVDGASLENVIRKQGRMDVIRACHYVSQAAAGLHFAHEAGLIHRDIKPDNLILDRTGVVKVLDMGVARFSQEEDEILTKGPLGTADYLSPEQAIDSHSADRRADVYSLGATLYYLLTGRVPFADGKSVAQKILFLQTKKPRSVLEFRPDVPEPLVVVLDKMMEKKQEDRHQTMEEVIEALLPWTETPIPPPPEDEMPAPVLGGIGGEATDANLGITPGPPGSRTMGTTSAPAGVSPARNARPRSVSDMPALKPKAETAAVKAKAEPAPVAATSSGATGRSLVWTVLLTVVATVSVGFVVWWMLLRP